MNVSIFGMGYVGVVSSACLAADGHTVIGVEPNETKRALINKGRSPIIEKDLEEILEAAVGAGRLSATDDAQDAVHRSDISLVCVGTPSLRNGGLDLSHVRRVCEDIGAALGTKSGFHVVVMRSTTLPGSMRDVVIPALEAASRKKAGMGFGVCTNPEFMREGSSVSDYRRPPKTVIGDTDPRSGDLLASLYEGLAAPLIRTSIETAEMIKYVDNAWHALKVAYANEIGVVCKSLGIDSHQVMDVFCQDTTLNLSPSYLKPGFAFGGSCLPKDLRALTHRARTLDLELPLLGAILPSNERQLDRGFAMIANAGKRRVGILGLSFKDGTDDLRESPIVAIVERLIGKGFDVRVFDKSVNMAALTGANRDYILNHIPHISRILAPSVQAVLEHAEVLVIANGAQEFSELVGRIRPDVHVIDFVRLAGAESSASSYDGICW